MFLIKSRYFESGSKRLEPGERYIGLHGEFSAFKWLYFRHFKQYSSKIVKTCQFLGVSSLQLGKI